MLLELEQLITKALQETTFQRWIGILVVEANKHGIYVVCNRTLPSSGIRAMRTRIEPNEVFTYRRDRLQNVSYV